MARAAVTVSGIADFQRELRKANREFPRELRKANKNAADLVRDKSRMAAATATRQQAKAARGIGSVAQTRSAAVTVTNGARSPFAIGAFFGAKQYAQFEPWTGNQWTPGDGGGPYVIGPAIQRNMDNILDTYGEAVEALAKRAFPT